MVTLNRAVAVAMVDGPRAGLELLATLDGDDRMADHHRLDAVRAHLLEMAGDHGAAREGYRAAARRTDERPRAALPRAPRGAPRVRGAAGHMSHVPAIRWPRDRPRTALAACRPDSDRRLDAAGVQPVVGPVAGEDRLS